MSGTFELIIDAIANQTGAWTVTPGGATDDAALIAAIKSNNSAAIQVPGTPPVAEATIGFNIGWFLDGSAVETPFASLPAGFTVTSARLELRIAIGTDQANYNTDTYKMFFANGLESRDFSNTAPDVNTGPTNRWYYYDHPASGLSALHLETDVIGISFTRPSNTGVNSFYYLVVTGTYDIAAYTWEIDDPTAQYQVGDTISVLSNDTNPDLTTVTEIELGFGGDSITIDSADFLNWTATTLDFLIPSGTDLDDYVGDVDVYGIIGGMSTLIGSFPIIVANISGIYKLVTNQRYDKVYTSHSTGDTTNVAIPRPFGKTGFLHG